MPNYHEQSKDCSRRLPILSSRVYDCRHIPQASRKSSFVPSKAFLLMLPYESIHKSIYQNHSYIPLALFWKEAGLDRWSEACWKLAPYSLCLPIWCLFWTCLLRQFLAYSSWSKLCISAETYRHPDFLSCPYLPVPEYFCRHSRWSDPENWVATCSAFPGWIAHLCRFRRKHRR